MKTTSYSTHLLLTALVTTVMTGIGTAKAEEMAVTITNDNFQHFSEVYNAVGSVDWFSAVCAKEAPEAVAQHQEVIANLVSDERLGQIRAILDATIQAQPGIKADVDAGLDQNLAMLQRSLGHSMSIFCQQRFEALVVPHTDVLMDVSALSPTLPPLPTKALEADAAQDVAEPGEADLSGDDDETAGEPEVVIITNGNFERFSDVYSTVEMFNRTISICDREVPDQVAAHILLANNVGKNYELGDLWVMLDATISAQPEIEPDLTSALEHTFAPLQGVLNSTPSMCGVGLEPTLKAIIEGLPDVATFTQDLVDDMGEGGAYSSAADRGAHIETSGADVPMPTELGRDNRRSLVARGEKALPGLSWQIPEGVRPEGGGMPCFWRCAIFKNKGRVPSFPTLVVHETLPLAADDAIDAVFSRYEKPVLEQQDVDANPFVGHMAMQPDRLVIQDVYVEDVVGQQRHRAFVLEKNGLSVVAILYYPWNNGGGDEQTTNDMVQLITTLEVDVDAVHASLRTPVERVKKPSSGEPPAADEVIYASKPRPNHNVITNNFQFFEESRYVEKSIHENEGPELDFHGYILQYMPPQPNGTTIEGAFETQTGYSVFGTGVSSLVSNRIAFSKNGKFSTSKSAGVIAGLASTGSSSQSDGTYQINGYTLELRLNDGTVQERIFFRQFGYINIDGNVMYPISAIQ